MNTNEQDFETQWKVREEELMKLPKEAVIGIHKLQSQLMFNSYEPMQARIKELEELVQKIHKLSEYDQNHDTLFYNYQDIHNETTKFLQSSKQL